MRTAGDTMMSVGDIMSRVRSVQYTGGYHEYTGRYHDECRGISLSTPRDVQYTGVSIQIQLFSQ